MIGKNAEVWWKKFSDKSPNKHSWSMLEKMKVDFADIIAITEREMEKDRLAKIKWEDDFYLSWHWSIHYSREFNESPYLELGRSLKFLSRFLSGYDYNDRCECVRCKKIELG